jgi:phosphatidate cytidylyltransferase
MAFNWQIFKTRTLTAIVFAAVMLAGLLINHWTFFILFSVIHFGCWWEYQKLVGLIDKEYQQITPVHKYGVMIAGWCIMLYFTNDAYHIFGLHLHELGWLMGLIFLFALPINELLFAKKNQLKNIRYSALGLLYISLSWGLMVDLYSEDISYDHIKAMYDNNGLWIPLWIVASIWINDTMAYIIGSLFGKISFSKISPKKTWEGTVGGVILSIVMAGLVSYFSDRFKPVMINMMIITAIVSIFGTLGDLLESKLKRMAGVKDSGTLMPGHGGFLDRFDSMLLAIPAVWLYVYFFIR